MWGATAFAGPATTTVFVLWFEFCSPGIEAVGPERKILHGFHADVVLNEITKALELVGRSGVRHFFGDFAVSRFLGALVEAADFRLEFHRHGFDFGVSPGKLGIGALVAGGEFAGGEADRIRNVCVESGLDLFLPVAELAKALRESERLQFIEALVDLLLHLLQGLKGFILLLLGFGELFFAAGLGRTLSGGLERLGRLLHLLLSQLLHLREIFGPVHEGILIEGRIAERFAERFLDAVTIDTTPKRPAIKVPRKALRGPKTMAAR